MKDRKSR